MDVLILSRLQFALTIMFHYLFPPLTIGLGVIFVYLEGMYVWRKEPIYEAAAKFWTRIFGLTFALGVVTGIVMEFQFGTNWAVYSRYVGDVFGSALAAEGIFAFFLEFGFLAVLLFGWDRVGPTMHFFATLIVAVGDIFSSIWITVANSWQQTPAGHVIREHVVNGQTFLRAEIVDSWVFAFVSSSATISALVCLFGFVLFPHLITSSPNPDHSLTIYNAASSATTLKIMAIIAAVGMPFVLVYTGIVYWTFRGAVQLEEHSY